MDAPLQWFLHLLDWFWLEVVVASARPLGEGLYRLTLAPLSHMGVSPLWQVVLVGLVASSISLVLKRLFRVDEKDAMFRSAIAGKMEIHDYLPALEDWRMKKILMEAADDDIDELYNTYVAHKFSWFGSVYLLPIFLALFWLDCQPGVTGKGLLMVFDEPVLGVPGISVPAAFFLGYLPGLLLGRRIMGDAHVRDRSNHPDRRGKEDGKGAMIEVSNRP